MEVSSDQRGCVDPTQDEWRPGVGRLARPSVNGI